MAAGILGASTHPQVPLFWKILPNGWGLGPGYLPFQSTCEVPSIHQASVPHSPGLCGLSSLV